VQFSFLSLPSRKKLQYEHSDILILINTRISLTRRIRRLIKILIIDNSEKNFFKKPGSNLLLIRHRYDDGLRFSSFRESGINHYIEPVLTNAYNDD